MFMVDLIRYFQIVRVISKVTFNKWLKCFKYGWNKRAIAQLGVE